MPAVICLDAGHSGAIEPGVVIPPWTEAKLNLILTLAVGVILQGYGYKLIYTRRGEVDNDLLGWRATLANESDASAFISTHCNGYDNPAANGVETYYAPNSRRGYHLATAIQANLVTLNYTRNRGIKEANYYVLTATHAPAVLIECGFMSNPADLTFLTNPKKQLDIANAIATGIMDWLKQDSNNL